MRRRRALVRLAGAALAVAALGARAQRERPARIALLMYGTPASHGAFADAFRLALRDLGWAEGRDVAFAYQWADGYTDRLPRLAAQLARDRPDIVVTATAAATRAAMAAAPAAAILMAYGSDPVGNGLVASLARPGGRVTGLSNLGEGIVPKMFEMLRALAPSLQQIALVFNPGNPTVRVYRADADHAARTLGVGVTVVEARTPEEIGPAFETLRRQRISGAVFAPDPMFLTERVRVVEFAARSGVATIYNQREFVAIGGLMSYGSDIRAAYARAAVFADRILRGADPGSLPVEQPTKFTLALNVPVARALGIAIPQTLLLRADEVIG